MVVGTELRHDRSLASLIMPLGGYNEPRTAIGTAEGGAGNQNDRGAPQPGLGGLLGNLGGMLGGAGVGSLLNGGLGELLENFKQNGQDETAQSWVRQGPNKEISPPQLKQVIGTDVLATLERHTGLSQDELLARLSRELPAAVDKYTPDGRLPSE